MSTQSAVIEQITPKQAAAWLDHNYEHNRPLSDKHVKFLAREMELGRFTLATIHFMYVGNEVHLVNGQHTLHAIVLSEKAQSCVIIREHGCNPADLPKVFMHYDIQRKRTFTDSVRAFGVAEKTGIQGYFLNRTASAMKYAVQGFGSAGGERSVKKDGDSRYLSVADLFEMVPLWKREIDLILESIAGAPHDLTKPIHTAKVFSVALITAYYQPNKAADFWHKVAFDNELEIGDPCKTLNRYLPRTIRRGRYDSDPIPPDIVTKSVTYCWNAYFENRALSRIQVKESFRSIPLSIAGTPYNGNQSPTFWPTRNQERIAA